MELPNDLKDFTAENHDDPFQIIPPDVAIVVLLCVIGFGAVFQRYM